VCLEAGNRASRHQTNGITTDSEPQKFNGKTKQHRNNSTRKIEPATPSLWKVGNPERRDSQLPTGSATTIKPEKQNIKKRTKV
jgi:hypothetical protein